DCLMMAQATSRRYEEWVDYPDGRRCLLDTLKTPFFSHNGQLIGLIGISRDITERQQADEALRQSEEKFRTLVANIPGVVYRCACDADWTMEFLSDFIEEITGYPAVDYMHNQVRSFASIIHPEDREMVERTVNEAVALRQPYILEYRVTHADGSLRWVYEKGQGIYSGDGELLWLDGAIFDISERKRAEQAVLKSENQLRRQQAGLIELAESQEFYSGNLNAALQALTEKAASILDVERVSVWFYNAAHTKICLNDLYTLTQQQHSSGIELCANDYPTYFQALETDEIIAVDEAQRDPRTREFLRSWLIPMGIISMLDVPIRSGGKTVGVICHEQVGS
ncbi:MAG: PAS domain S-box protein, partial [Microcystaceae cyanobacterium]